MASTQPIPRGEHVPTADQRVVMRVPWSHYEAELAVRGDRSSPRISFLDGVMELMSPSKDRERIKSYIGMLIEAFAMERGLDLSPYGSWTLKAAPKQAGVEPDECYLLGSDQSRETPDLVIEVIWTSGGIDKLEAYRRLGVPEVWFWKDGAIAVHVLDVANERYDLAPRSVCFAGPRPRAAAVVPGSTDGDAGRPRVPRRAAGYGLSGLSRGVTPEPSAPGRAVVRESGRARER